MPRLSLSLQDVLDCTHTSRLSRESLSVLDAFRPFLLPAVTAAFSSTLASCRSLRPPLCLFSAREISFGRHLTQPLGLRQLRMEMVTRLIE